MIHNRKSVNTQAEAGWFKRIIAGPLSRPAFQAPGVPIGIQQETS